jgi:hypothetical protein
VSPNNLAGSLIIGASATSTPITSDISIGTDESIDNHGIDPSGLVRFHGPYAGDLTLVRGDVLGTGANFGIQFEDDLTGTVVLNDSGASDLVGTIDVAGEIGPGALIDIHGNMGTSSLVSIGEDLDGHVRVRGRCRGDVIVTDQITATGVVEVGDDLSTEGLIHAKATSNPFAGQVIINSLRATSNAWVGAVN